MGRPKLPLDVFTGKDLSGKIFGRMTVLCFAGKKEHPNGKAHIFWKCKCSCGKTKAASSCALVTGHTKSCGCLSAENRAARNFVHGLKDSPIYGIWKNMNRRCDSETCADYPRYGGRGIKVSKAWKSFKVFHDDMIGSYQKGLTLERTNNNKGYSKTNCMWATKSQQVRNTRSNRWIKIGKEQLILGDWLRRYGISWANFYVRLKKGMTPAQGITWPKRKRWKLT